MTKPTCQYCGANMHDGTCPRIKRIEYGPSAIAGGPPIIMAVEFHPFTVEFTNEDATMLLSGSMLKELVDTALKEDGKSVTFDPAKGTWSKP